MSTRDSLDKPPKRVEHKHLVHEETTRVPVNTTQPSKRNSQPEVSLNGEVLLWCDRVSDVRTKADSNLQRSKEAEAVASQRCKQEWEVEYVYNQLREKHMQTLVVPRLKLPARRIISGVTPDYPEFSGTIQKRAQRESFSDAIGRRAVAIVKALSDS